MRQALRRMTAQEMERAAAEFSLRLAAAEQAAGGGGVLFTAAEEEVTAAARGAEAAEEEVAAAQRSEQRSTETQLLTLLRTVQRQEEASGAQRPAEEAPLAQTAAHGEEKMRSPDTAEAAEAAPVPTAAAEEERTALFSRLQTGEMEEISEYFRRDSRRYDGAFGGGSE